MILRVTEVIAYLDCSAKFYFQTIERVQTPRSLALAFGTSVHSALEKNYQQKLETKTDISLPEAIDTFSDAYEAETAEVEKTDFKEESKGEVKDSGIRLITKYHKEVAPRIQPQIVEQRIEAKFKGIEHSLTGKIDLLDVQDTLIDHKTSARTPADASPSYVLQNSAYNILLSAKGHTIKNNRIDYLVRKQTPEIKHIPVTPDKNHFLRIYQVVTNAIDKGVFVPNRGSLFCSRKWCKYANNCMIKYGGSVKQ